MYLRIMLYLGLLSARTGEREILEIKKNQILIVYLIKKKFNVIKKFDISFGPHKYLIDKNKRKYKKRKHSFKTLHKKISIILFESLQFFASNKYLFSFGAP